jgi:hypothetical protein
MLELHDILPKALKETLDSIDYEEVGGLLITGFKLLGNDLQVHFTLSFYESDLPKQYWQIEIKGIEIEKIVPEYEGYPRFYSDHYLLYDFTDNYIELYFKGSADNSENLFIDLYSLHRNLFENQIEIDKYLYAPDGILRLCERGHGLFAKGPEKILEEYAKCLLKHNISSYLIGEIEREKKNLKLLRFGESYFIGESFVFTQI